MAAKDSVDVTLAHTEQDSSLEKSSFRVLDSSNKPRPSALIDFSLWNDYGCLSYLVSFGFLLCFCESLTVSAFLCIWCQIVNRIYKGNREKFGKLFR